ncbi:uncharacterized protein Z519_08840 [Cladophialophora bantiana CBS 173.52]|uniref:Uncharacterized protein n=1 Tax=Cladophialophora bantiana (strain ATCC 10958 / CBS 173.52 / CDC B-1940 / NIH 8579) TaxID=1442370 RepID=A0A0D2FUG9_CLAB1|nr:uncharacterized protein Z519_08840 [Cladophialophora bantiana CBS 173.52]KIW90197.1 hypothetical protein Z519_08840 [Cladophialophora bantiana CBS 173.52]
MRLTKVLFDADHEEPPPRKEVGNRLLLLYEELSSIINALPEHLRATDASTPAVLTHYNYFQVLVLRMFLFLKQPAEDASPAVQQRAKESCIKSSLEVARFCKIYMSAYGSSIMTNTWTQSTSVALYTLVEEVAASDKNS